MSVELGVILGNCLLSLAAIIKVLVSQNSSKKTNDSFEAEIKVLREKVNRLDKLDEKFDKVNDTLIEVKTQLDMLLTMNGIKPMKKA